MRLLIFFVIISFCSCAPTLTEMQSARTIEKNMIELTPSYSRATLSRNAGNNSLLQNQFGLGIGYGISDRIDLKLKYEWINTSLSGFENASIFGLEGKYNIFRDKVSFSTAFGRGIGQNLGDSWQLHPKVILTLPIIYDKLEISLIPKYLITFSDNYNNLLSSSLGLGYSQDLSKWALRLEYGILVDPSRRSEGFINSFSLGFNYTL